MICAYNKCSVTRCLVIVFCSMVFYDFRMKIQYIDLIEQRTQGIGNKKGIHDKQ